MKTYFNVLITILLIASISISSFAQDVAVNIQSREIKEINIVETQGIDVPVLMYHHISDEVKNGTVVTPEKFKQDMELLKEEGYEGIFLTELADYLNGYIELPEKPIVITFDDGYYSNYEYAFPIAKELEMKMTISVIGWSVGRTTFIDSDNPITPHFAWKEAKEMQDSGFVDIQNHTFDLHSPEGESYGYNTVANKGVLPFNEENFSVYKKRLMNDLLKLNIQIFNEVGNCSTFLTFPYGAYTDETERALKSIGFVGSLTTESGIRNYKSLSDLWEMPRVNVVQGLSGYKLINAISPKQTTRGL